MLDFPTIDPYHQSLSLLLRTIKVSPFSIVNSVAPPAGLEYLAIAKIVGSEEAAGLELPAGTDPTFEAGLMVVVVAVFVLTVAAGFAKVEVEVEL